MPHHQQKKEKKKHYQDPVAQLSFVPSLAFSIRPMNGTIRDRTMVQFRPDGASRNVLEAPGYGYSWIASVEGLIVAWKWIHGI